MGALRFFSEKVEWKAQLQLKSSGSEKEFKQHLCQLYSQRRPTWPKSYKEVKSKGGIVGSGTSGAGTKIGKKDDGVLIQPTPETFPSGPTCPED